MKDYSSSRIIFPFSVLAFSSLPRSFDSLTISFGKVVINLVYSVFPTFLSNTSLIFIITFRYMKFINLSVPERSFSDFNLTAHD